jgi:hypothetical protein
MESSVGAMCRLLKQHHDPCPEKKLAQALLVNQIRAEAVIRQLGIAGFCSIAGNRQ